ncbi:MAG: BTAD domain-containing putative transcriptional regulator [Nocardiopsaceae bacterium]|nr:BTAD domain-containing putative transcriptional regulator [Nocardiopsaceae bacterium]
MEFGVLGPISAWYGGEPVSVGGPRQRCVLGALLVNLGQEVTVERLIDYLWDDNPPRTARSVIQVQVSHLRRAFPDVIHTTAGGYLARVDPERVDLHRFRGLVAQALAAEDPAAAVLLWERALACWRGKPFSGTGSDRLWYTVCRPLLEEHWAAVTGWAECAFSLHRYSEIITRVTPLVREDPLRERLQYLLIAALHKSGQRASALTVFHETRKYLAEELGVDPSPEVMELHQQILRDMDGAAEASPSSPASVSAREALPPAADENPPELVARNDLPRDTPDFTGREHDLAEILRVDEGKEKRAEISVITGPGGAGKTTLAVHAAHRIAERYPDGQLFIDLHGYTVDQDPLGAFSALGILLRAIGLSPKAVPDSLEERSALWRSMLAGKRVLVVLDNAINFAQVSPLLSAAPGSFTIITTRNDLPGLSGARYLSLGMFSEDSSLQFFSAVLGDDRVKQEYDRALDVVRLCGGLPLALRIVVGRMLNRPQWTFSHIRQRLSEHRRRFRELRVDGKSVEAVFELSYQSLNEGQKTTFLFLGMMIGGSVDLHGAAALLHRDPPETDDLLQELVSVRLLDEPAADLYRFHDLIGAYARQKALAELSGNEIDAARGRLAEHYLDMADRAADWIGLRGHEYEVDSANSSRYRSEFYDRVHAVSWFERNQENLASVVDFFAAIGAGEQAWQLADSLWRFYATYGRTELLIYTQEKALAVSRAQENRRGSAVSLIGLGIAHCMAGRFDVSLALLNEAREMLESIDDPRGKVRVYGNLGMVYERVGRFHDALSCFWKVFEYAVSVQDVRLEALQRINIALMYQILGDWEKCIDFCAASIELKGDEGQLETQAAAMRIMGEVNAHMGKTDESFRQLKTSLELTQALGAQSEEIYCRNGLAVALRKAGKTDDAIDSHLQALEIGEERALHSADAEILTELGLTYAQAARYEDARVSHERALTIAKERGERHVEARALMGLGMLPRDVIERDAAVSSLATAVTIFEELGVPEVGKARSGLQRLRGEDNGQD